MTLFTLLFFLGLRRRTPLSRVGSYHNLLQLHSIASTHNLNKGKEEGGSHAAAQTRERAPTALVGRIGYLLEESEMMSWHHIAARVPPRGTVLGRPGPTTLGSAVAV